MKRETLLYCYPDSALRPLCSLVPRDAPTLWERAHAFYLRLVCFLESSGEIAMQAITGRTYRAQVTALLTPIEKLVRSLLLIDAIAWLLMTPEGGKVMDGAGDAAPRRAMARRRPPPAHTAPSTDDKRISGRPFLLLEPIRLYDYSAMPSQTVAAPRTPGHPTAEPGAVCSLRLARRIDALYRTLVNPERAMRRLARLIASTRPQSILVGDLRFEVRLDWMQGYEECLNAGEQRLLALNLWDKVLLQRRARLLEPG